MGRAKAGAPTFIGDIYDVQTFYFLNWICHSMPTALARIYTPDGFVIAADGRACGDTFTNITTDDMRKIFGLESGGRKLAYSVTGTETLASDISKGAAFSFLKEFRCAADGINPALSRNLHGHCVRIGRNIHKALLCAKTSGKIGKYPSQCRKQEEEPGATIVRIFVDGYFNGQPSRVQMRFWHQDQALKEPDVVPQEMLPGLLLTQGSAAIGHLLFGTDDERFARYRCTQTKIDGIVAAASLAASYIQACSDPVAREIDNICLGIGGTMHIAAVTPTDGFQWVPGFEPTDLPTTKNLISSL
jgi:hypothetical protein